MGPAYGLTTQLSADTPQIRAALREPLDDPDQETREEAVCGLAKRRDEVAFEPSWSTSAPDSPEPGASTQPGPGETYGSSTLWPPSAKRSRA